MSKPQAVYLYRLSTERWFRNRSLGVPFIPSRHELKNKKNFVPDIFDDAYLLVMNRSSSSSSLPPQHKHKGATSNEETTPLASFPTFL